MCTKKSSYEGQEPCFCRRKKAGAEVCDKLKKIAPNLPADWEQSVGWRQISADVTEEEPVCGICESWWVGAIKEIKAEPQIAPASP